jgi:hypothetical protein
MSNYFVIQTNDESAAYAFKTERELYRPADRKVQRVQSTVTGKLDVQSAPNELVWNYGAKFSGTEAGSFAVEAGTIMTATSVSWGTASDLKALFQLSVPPARKLRFRDFDGYECYIFFDGERREELKGPMTDGPKNVFVTFRGSL